MTPEQLDNFTAQLRAHEGWESFCYLDIDGNVTCGCGHLIANWVAALKLPFAPPITAPEFAALQHAAPKMRAEFYAPFTRGRLTDAQIAAIRDADIAEVQRELAAEFPAYASWPPSADAGMTEMGFNFGIPRLLKLFPKFCDFARACDWAACAAECHRQQIGEARNEYTKQLFLQAASESTTTGAPQTT